MTDIKHMKTLVFVKGRKEPIVVKGENARKIRDIYSDPQSDPSMKIDLGTWMGTLSCVRDLGTPRPESVAADQGQLSNADLNAFEKSDLAPYLTESGYLDQKQEMFYYRDKKLVTIHNEKYNYYMVIGEMANVYETISSTVEQWKSYRMRVAFAQDMDARESAAAAFSPKANKVQSIGERIDLMPIPA